MAEKITVLVPTYNRASFLGACLRSLLTQTLAPHEIIVINDGSTDNTVAVLRDFADTLSVIDTPQRGKPAALNAGLHQTTGDYVWIFDDDDVALPDALARFVQPFRQHSDIGFTYSSYWYTPTLDNGQLGTPWGQSYVPDVEKEGFLVPLLESNFLGGAALFAKKDCYDAVGEFDETLIRSQDYDMAIRIARQFRGIQVSGGPTFHYRQHDGLRGGGGDRFTSDRRNLKWLEYDQLIFKRLYRELPLDAYCRPSWVLHPRALLVQRAAIMAGKGMIDEVIADLALLSRDADQSALSPEEQRLMVSGLAETTWYGSELASSTRIVAALRRMQRDSPVIREIYRAAQRAIVKELLHCSRTALGRSFSRHGGRRHTAYRRWRVAAQKAVRWFAG